MKVETIEEFLARGGKPEILPYQDPKNVKDLSFGNRVNSSVPPSNNFITMGEAELFHGDMSKAHKAKKLKTESKIDMSLLPESLRKKYFQEMNDE